MTRGESKRAQVLNRKKAFFWSLLGLGLLGYFNSCSEVTFSKVDGEEGGLCLPGTSASGCIPTSPEIQELEETFIVPISTKKVDILLVLDNSGSMTPELSKLASKLDGLVQTLDEGGIDWQMCHVLTDPAVSTVRDWSNKAGQNLGKVLTPATKDKSAVFISTIESLPRQGAGDEQGLSAIRNAIRAPANVKCFREGAALSTVVISDEDQKSCGGRCVDWQSSENPAGTQYRNASEYRKQYRDLNENDDAQNLADFVKKELSNKIFVNHSIVIRPGDSACYDVQDKQYPAFYGVIYKKLQSLTGGVLGDLCASSYADQLKSMGERTRDSLNSVTLKCPPIATPAVTIAPNPGVSWSLSGNKVVFASALPEGTSVKVKYHCAVTPI